MSIRSILLFAALLTGLSAAPDTTIAPGKSVTLSVSADGTAPFSYIWFYQNVGGSSQPTGITAAAYSIPSFSAANVGTYSVQVSNSAGSTLSDTAKLVLLAVPTITTQPLSQILGVGTKLTLSVVATGSPTFQWQRNGVNIVGATSSTFSIAAVALTDGADYRVVVTNPTGSVTSVTAKVIVATPPSGAVLKIIVQ
jgi:Ig-like domain-containing protein